MLFGASWGQHYKGFYQCNAVPRVLRQHWPGYFFLYIVVFRLKDIIGWIFIPVSCCSRSIKTTLNRIYFCALLFWSLSRTTLHRVFTCAMLSQEYYNTDQDFSVTSLTTLHKVLPVLCCPRSIKTPLIKIFSCAMLPGACWTTLYTAFTCSILAHG